MASVPFEKLGPGQSGRLVYQVLGVDGPFSNPTGIRYLPPDAAGDQLAVESGLPAAGIALGVGQLASLGLGIANVAISSATLYEVKKMNDRLDAANRKLDSMGRDISEILRRVQRIDINVAENNLRSSLQHVLRRAIRDDVVDLEALTQIAGDLDKFEESLGAPILNGTHPNLRLSSDVRDMLSSVDLLLTNARRHFLEDYHSAVGTNPALTWNDGLLVASAQTSPAAVVANLVVRDALPRLKGHLEEAVAANSWAGNTSAVSAIEAAFAEDVPSWLDGRLYSADPGSNLVADVLESKVDVDSEDLAAAISTVEDYLNWWWSTDASLILGLQIELQLRQGEFFTTLGKTAKVALESQTLESPIRVLNLAEAERQLRLLEVGD